MYTIGRLTKDPTMSQNPNAEYCSFSVAADSDRRDRDSGNFIPAFFNVTVFSAQRTACMQYLHKGSKVFISGSFSPRTYQDRDGMTRTSLDVTAREVQFLDAKPQGGTSSKRASAPRKEEHAADIDPDALPF